MVMSNLFRVLRRLIFEIFLKLVMHGIIPGRSINLSNRNVKIILKASETLLQTLIELFPADSRAISPQESLRMI